MTLDTRSEQLPAWILLSSSAISSTINTITLNPFEVVKTTQQLYPELNFRTSLKHITKLHGGPIRGLYRGLIPALILSVPANMIYFTLYDRVRLTMIDKGWESSVTGFNIVPFAAGTTSRLFLVILGTPLEFARVYQQTHPGATWLSSFRTAGGGLRNSFRGLSSTILRDAPYAGIYWSTIESLRKASFWNYILPESNSNEPSKLRLMCINFMSAATGSGLACIITNPLDVIKTRVQSSDTPKRIIDVIREMQQSRLGLWRNLSAGVFSRVLRAAPSGAILYSCYEVMKSLLITFSSSQPKKLIQSELWDK
jgi:solute carrier family 25 protein 39/40